MATDLKLGDHICYPFRPDDASLLHGAPVYIVCTLFPDGGAGLMSLGGPDHTVRYMPAERTAAYVKATATITGPLMTMLEQLGEDNA